jgi:hypothetical protein
MDLRLKRGWRKYFWQRLHNPFGQTMPAFVVGCGRSGTSMILHHLGRSWTVDPYNENHPAAFEKWRLRPLDVIEKLVDRSYAQVTLFKPVLTTPHSCEYLTRFPDARLIFVYRHYNDVVNSSLKRFGPADRLAHVNSWIANDFNEFAPIPPPEPTKALVRRLWQPSLSPESAAALYWLFYNRLYFDLGLSQEKRVKLIGYESLVANPSSEIREACLFLGLNFELSMAAGIFSTSVRRDETPPMDQAIESACEALWQRLQAALTQGDSA